MYYATKLDHLGYIWSIFLEISLISNDEYSVKKLSMISLIKIVIELPLFNFWVRCLIFHLS